MTAQEQAEVLSVSESTRLRWHSGRRPDASPDLLDRLALLVRLYQRLVEIAGSDAEAAAWIRREGSAARSDAPKESVLDTARSGSLLRLYALTQHFTRVLSASWYRPRCRQSVSRGHAPGTPVFRSG